MSGNIAIKCCKYLLAEEEHIGDHGIAYDFSGLIVSAEVLKTYVAKIKQNDQQCGPAAKAEAENGPPLLQTTSRLCRLDQHKEML